MTAEEMIRVGKQFAAQNPRFEENQHNVDLMIAAFTVVKRHRPEYGASRVIDYSDLGPTAWSLRRCCPRLTDGES